MATEMEHLREDLNNVEGSVDELKEKPGKRWDSVIAAIIGAFAGGIGTALIGFIVK